MLKSKRVIWWTTIVGATLAVLIGSLVVVGQGSMSTASSGSYYEPNAQPPSSVQTGGTTDNGVTFGGKAWDSLRVGYVGRNKIIQDSAEVSIPRLGNDKWGLVETNVTVKRTAENGSVMQTLQGKALVFANTRNTADVGYVMVSQSEARTWVSVLNGNPSYVFDSSKSNIYPYTIENLETGEKLTAYSLADIAYKSGGKGDPPPGDGLTKIRDTLYFKRDGFIATSRPYAEVSTDKSKYEIGETVKIDWDAEAYSSYDNGYHVDGLSVVHKDTGQKWDYILNDQVLRTSAGGSAQRSLSAAATNESQSMRSASLQSSPTPEGTQINFTLPKNPFAHVVEFIDGNLTQDAPFTKSQIPSEVAKLPKDRVYRLVIQDSPDYLPKTPGTNWTVGTMLRTGWDVSYVLLDTPDPVEGQVPVSRVPWESLEIFSAYENPNGTNVIMAKLKEQ